MLMKTKVIQDATFDLIIYYQDVEKFCLPGMDDKLLKDKTREQRI